MPLNKKTKSPSKKTVIICMTILYVCSLTLMGIGIWLLTPVPKPQVHEAQGVIENIVVRSSRYSNFVNIKINGKTYTAIDGANRAIDKNKIKGAFKGDSVSLSYEVGTNEIRSLTINGDVYFTIEEYLKQEHIYRLYIGVMVIVLGVVFSGLGIFILRTQRKKRKPTNTGDYPL